MQIFPSVALFLIALPLGCGSPEETSDPPKNQPEAGDGKYHPPGNGVFILEEASCQMLLAAQKQKLDAMACIPNTTRDCPEMIRALGLRCGEFDEGSVSGCAQYYTEQPSCEALAAAVKNCIPTPKPETCVSTQ